MLTWLIQTLFVKTFLDTVEQWEEMTKILGWCPSVCNSKASPSLNLIFTAAWKRCLSSFCKGENRAQPNYLILVRIIPSEQKPCERLEVKNTKPAKRSRMANYYPIHHAFSTQNFIRTGPKKGHLTLVNVLQRSPWDDGMMKGVRW